MWGFSVSRCIAFLLVIVVLVGCTRTVAVQPTASVVPVTTRPVPSPSVTRVQPTPIPAQTSTPVETAGAFSGAPGWHTVFVRPGFTGRGSIDLRATGDIMLARNVEHMLRARKSGWLLGPSANLLAGDVVVGNLESPFSDRRRPENLRPGPYRLAADPAFVAELRPYTALSLANNHALDAGPLGLSLSQHTLTAAGIGVLGVHGDICGADLPITTTTSLPIRMLAFNAVHDPQDRSDEAHGCGRAWLDDAALDSIRLLRRASPTPIAVFVHWGEEYAPLPNAEQRQWASRLVAAGADLIVGSHPHVVQPAEEVTAAGRRGFVAFSLGNFVFDQPMDPARSHSVVLRVWLDAQGVGAVAAAPVSIVDGQPLPLGLDEPEAQPALAALVPQQAVVEPSPTPTDAAALYAWRWDGKTFVTMPVPPGTVLPPEPNELQVDLRGNGEPMRTTLEDGVARVWDGPSVVWENEAKSWQVAGITSGDADNDGRFEVLLRLWKPDQSGVLRSQPFLVGWRGGYYRVFWGGSPVARPIQDAAIGAVDGMRNALVVLEGGKASGDPADHVGVWLWQSWTFAEEWQSEAGAYHRLALLDLNNDGIPEIVAR